MTATPLSGLLLDRFRREVRQARRTSQRSASRLAIPHPSSAKRFAIKDDIAAYPAPARLPRSGPATESTRRCWRRSADIQPVRPARILLGVPVAALAHLAVTYRLRDPESSGCRGNRRRRRSRSRRVQDRMSAARRGRELAEICLAQHGFVERFVHRPCRRCAESLPGIARSIRDRWPRRGPAARKASEFVDFEGFAAWSGCETNSLQRIVPGCSWNSPEPRAPVRLIGCVMQIRMVEHLEGPLGHARIAFRD